MAVKTYKLIAIDIASISIDAHKVNFGNGDAKQSHYYSVLQMSAYSSVKQKTITVRVCGFYFAVSKMKTQISREWMLIVDVQTLNYKYRNFYSH